MKIATNETSQMTRKMAISAPTVVLNTPRKPSLPYHRESTSSWSARLSATIATIKATATAIRILRGRINLAVLFAAPDLHDVFAHDVGRAEPDEDLEGEVADDHPIELADNRDHVELERGRRQHERQAHPRHQLGQPRHALVSHQAIEHAHELRQGNHQPTELHRPEELHAQYLGEHRLGSVSIIL